MGGPWERLADSRKPSLEITLLQDWLPTYCAVFFEQREVGNWNYSAEEIHERFDVCISRTGKDAMRFCGWNWDQEKRFEQLMTWVLDLYLLTRITKRGPLPNLVLFHGGSFHQTVISSFLIRAGWAPEVYRDEEANARSLVVVLKNDISISNTV